MTPWEITPEDLLAGSTITFDVVIPPEILHPSQGSQLSASTSEQDVVVQLRPLTIGTFGVIMKAARSDPAMIPLLMIKEPLVQPQLSLEQVKKMHLGLVNFLIAQIRQISGRPEKKT